MLEEYWFKNNLEKFAETVAIFSLMLHGEHGVIDQPFYEFLSEDEHLIRLEFRVQHDQGIDTHDRWHGSSPRYPAGIIYIESTGFASRSHLVVQADKDIWNDVAPAWFALRDNLMKQNLIEPWQPPIISKEDFVSPNDPAPLLPTRAKPKHWFAWFDWYYRQAWGQPTSIEHMTKHNIKSKSQIESMHALYMEGKRNLPQ